jgi:hypothetical protein
MTSNDGIKIAESMQSGPGIYFLAGSDVRMSAIVQWNQASAPMRFIDAGLWRVSNYQVFTVPTDANSMIETSEGSVGYFEDTGTKRKVVLGFKIEDSNLPLFAGFPIFMANALNWIEEGIHPQMPTTTNQVFKKEGEISSGTSYVNFADENESNLTPGKVESSSAPDSQITMVRQDFSTWFLLALLGVVMLEWWAFHHKG